jgi:hypothetical protein
VNELTTSWRTLGSFTPVVKNPKSQTYHVLVVIIPEKSDFLKFKSLRIIDAFGREKMSTQNTVTKAQCPPNVRIGAGFFFFSGAAANRARRAYSTQYRQGTFRSLIRSRAVF